MKRKAEPKKFYFVEVNPRPCSTEELELHLRAFGNEFIEPSNLNRWTHIIFEKPEKAKNELSKLGNCINKKFFHTLIGSESFPVSLFEKFGNREGVFFDGIEVPCKLTASEAASLKEERDVNALFSIIPGKLALFFFRDGDVMLCEKK